MKCPLWPAHCNIACSHMARRTRIGSEDLHHNLCATVERQRHGRPHPLTDNPQKRHLSAESLVFYALKNAFCPSQTLVPPWER